MDRIVNHFHFLLRLIKSRNREYRLIISDLDEEQARAIVNCVSLSGCSNKHKTLSRITRTRNLKKIREVLLRNEKLLKRIICSILLTAYQACCLVVCSNDG